MTKAELILHLRARVLRDTAKPYLWSDDELAQYLNEAQDQFARRTHQLSDEVSDFTFIETEAGVALYVLDPRIVFVKDVRHTDNGAPLRDRTRGQMRRTVSEGRPCVYTTDSAHKYLRLSPTPDAVYTLDLLVARKPLELLVNDEDVPEIEEDYHLVLCDWAAYRALRNNDPDGSNTVAAADFRADWELRVRDAKRDVIRLRAGNMPMARNNWTGKRR